MLRVLRPIDHSEFIANIGTDRVKEIEQQARKTADGYIKKVAGDLEKEGIATQTVLISGNPPHEILDYIHNNQIDLVIMSTHGRSGPSRWFLGSVAERVIKHSKVPLLIVRPGGFKGWAGV